jgi:signal transduction histidine kinase
MFDLRQGLETTLRLLADRLRHSSVTIERRYRSERASVILGRPRQLNQVFLNLLDNALRASPSGGHIYLTIGDTERGRVFVSVADDGEGVSPENRERIFDPFFTTRPPGEGTGLGLYLSRQIVEAHGGSLRVSTGTGPGRGAEFVVELPTGIPDTRGVDGAPESQLSGPQSGRLRHEGAVA